MNNVECRLSSQGGQCCCTCAHHLKDFSHPETDGKPITNQRGWICANPEVGGLRSGWGEHGLCECHRERDCQTCIHKDRVCGQYNCKLCRESNDYLGWEGRS